MSKRLKILVMEPFFGGSHRQWAEGYQKNSRHEIELLTLPGRHWKWRMHGAAVSFAERFKQLESKPDLIVSTDMLDLATFKGLCGDCVNGIPTVVYFHENQITYPWSSKDEDIVVERDNHYGFINYTSALAADKVFFNSEYHRRSFIKALEPFLQQFPDNQNVQSVAEVERKSEVLYLGMNLSELDSLKPGEISKPNRATVLWNHRWEYDKNPEQFFEALYEIQDRGWEFNLIVLGEQFKNSPQVFSEARERLQDRIIHWGFVESRKEYVEWLWQADILPVTSNQDFFGGSVVEAMYCNVKPLLPNRLAYPEHIPKFLHHVFLYDENELVDRLQRWIKDISVLRNQQTRTFVKQYDWSMLAENYDTELQNVANC